MPVVQASNAYLGGIAIQSNEATVPTAANYSFPVFSANIGPRFDLRRVAVTNAASIIGDPYKSPTHWAGTVALPAFDDSLGTFLKCFYPTDTPSGTAPNRVHAFSGLGGVQSWVALYAEWLGSLAFEQTFGKGLISSLRFVVTEEGGPLRLEADFVGQEPAVANWTVTTADLISAGWFGMQLSSATIELDFDSPNSNPSSAVTNVQSVTIAINRPVTPVPTATGVTVANLSQGPVDFSGSQMQVLKTSWDSFRGTYYGTVGGSAVSPNILYGALELNFKHFVSATSLFSLYIPKVAFITADPEPNPDGSPLTETITLEIAAPTSGDHIVPTLTNNVTPAY